MHAAEHQKQLPISNVHGPKTGGIREPIFVCPAVIVLLKHCHMNGEGIRRWVTSLWMALLCFHFNTRGSSLLDPSFQLDPRVKGTVDIVTIQADGRILIAGVFTNFTAKEYALLVRLDPSGRLDPTFEPFLEQPTMELGVGFGISAPITDVHCQKNGQIVVGRKRYAGGLFPQAFTSLDILDSHGRKAFESGASGYLNIAIDRNDKIIAAGQEFKIEGTGARFTIVLRRFSEFGVPDGGIVPPPEFSKSTSAHMVKVTGLRLAQNGDILLTGQFYMEPPSVTIPPETGALRLQENGTLLWKLPITAIGNDSVILSEDSNGQIYLGSQGWATIKRFTSDGKPISDAPFLVDGGWNGGFLMEPDGRMLLTRRQTSAEGVPQIGIAAFLPDATHDTAFDTGSGFANDGRGPIVNSLARQADGMILAGGAFRTFDGISRPSLVRLFSHNPTSKAVITARWRSSAVDLEWPVEETGYTLESFDASDESAAWLAHPATVNETERRWTVTIPLQDESKLFRLRK